LAAGCFCVKVDTAVEKEGGRLGHFVVVPESVMFDGL
jgi:hypothetical protein